MSGTLSLPMQLTAISAGLLILRLVIGLAMAAHASQKLFGWFGGHGLAGTAGYFEMLGFLFSRKREDDGKTMLEFYLDLYQHPLIEPIASTRPA